jgi:hypothetical protein
MWDAGDGEGFAWWRSKNNIDITIEREAWITNCSDIRDYCWLETRVEVEGYYFVSSFHEGLGEATKTAEEIYDLYKRSPSPN